MSGSGEGDLSLTTQSRYHGKSAFWNTKAIPEPRTPRVLPLRESLSQEVEIADVRESIRIRRCTSIAVRSPVGAIFPENQPEGAMPN
jgi:hypothetical protein